MSYCRKCGFELEDDSLFCSNCGTPIEDDFVVASAANEQNREQAGKEQEHEKYEPEPVQKNQRTSLDDGKQKLNSAKQSLQETGDKAFAGMKSIAAQVGKTVEKSKAAADEEVKKEIEEQQRKKEDITIETGTKYMSDTDLWSWLKQKSKREHFYTEEPIEIEERDFMELVQKKIKENNVPARIEEKRIRWDRSNIERNVFAVKPITEVVNPFSCLLQFNKIGKFTFVENKMFITPPDLPAVPMKPLEIDETTKMKAKNALIGAVLIVVGLMLTLAISPVCLFVVLCGAIFVAAGWKSINLIRSIEEHNKRCAEQKEKWEEAWENWSNSIFVHSFQEDINGHLSRIFEAVYECIKQVSNETLKVQPVDVQEDNHNMNELEQLIARRKADYQ